MKLENDNIIIYHLSINCNNNSNLPLPYIGTMLKFLFKENLLRTYNIAHDEQTTMDFISEQKHNNNNIHFTKRKLD